MASVRSIEMGETSVSAPQYTINSQPQRRDGKTANAPWRMHHLLLTIHLFFVGGAAIFGLSDALADAPTTHLLFDEDEPMNILDPRNTRRMVMAICFSAALIDTLFSLWVFASSRSVIGHAYSAGKVYFLFSLAWLVTAIVPLACSAVWTAVRAEVCADVASNPDKILACLISKPQWGLVTDPLLNFVSCLPLVIHIYRLNKRINNHYPSKLTREDEVDESNSSFESMTQYYYDSMSKPFISGGKWYQYQPVELSTLDEAMSEPLNKAALPGKANYTINTQDLVGIYRD